MKPLVLLLLLAFSGCVTVTLNPSRTKAAPATKTAIVHRLAPR